jgi:hypothetical protein
MNRAMTALSAAILSLAALTAQAGDLRTMMQQPGEWEITFGGGMIPTTTQHGCYAGNKTVADLTNKPLKNCNQQSVNISGGMATVDAVCQFQGMKVTVHSNITPTGEAAFHGDNQIHIDGMPAIQGIPNGMNVNLDAHRTGPCAPGEKPM